MLIYTNIDIDTIFETFCIPSNDYNTKSMKKRKMKWRKGLPVYSEIFS